MLGLRVKGARLNKRKRDVRAVVTYRASGSSGSSAALSFSTAPFAKSAPGDPSWPDCFRLLEQTYGQRRGSVAIDLEETGAFGRTLISAAVDLDSLPPGDYDQWLPGKKGELHVAVSFGGMARLQHRYELGKQLGDGESSVVHLATERETGRKVAVKVCQKRCHEDDPKQMLRLQREVENMAKLKHPHIVELIETFSSSQQLFVVLEYLSGGDLYGAIIDKGCFTEVDAADVLKQLLSGTAYMHQNGVAHRDLKPENLMLVGNVPWLYVKIADFGLSKDFNCSRLSTQLGSPAYIAPEILFGNKYDCSCDIWSLGVILYALLSGTLPFVEQNEQALFTSILQAAFDFYDPAWNDISPEAKDLITNMLQKDPTKRPTAEQCLAHPWLSKGKQLPDRVLVRSLGSLRKLRPNAPLLYDPLERRISKTVTK
eukprot:m51a1_g8795 putative myosin light chain (428) ;mRNA; f:239348-242860